MSARLEGQTHPAAPGLPIPLYRLSRALRQVSD